MRLKRHPYLEKSFFFCPTQNNWINCHIPFIQKRFDEEDDSSEFFLLLAIETDMYVLFYDTRLKLWQVLFITQGQSVSFSGCAHEKKSQNDEGVPN